MLWKKDKLFCDICPAAYKISEQKEIAKRHLQNRKSPEKFAKTHEKTLLPVIIAENSSHMIKTGRGIDPVLQRNKADNIRLSASALDGLVIHPGETFSFWITVGKTTKRRGYKDGRVIEGDKVKPGIGGGLCNLGNSLHLLVLHSPLDVTEFHNHSDALAPDHGERVPFATGTSISYNNVDYRFKNNTDQTFQLHIYCQGDTLKAQLRCEREVPFEYRLTEEGHCFRKEGEKYFRVSKIYIETIDRQTGEVVDKKLVLDNHSEVMFDYDLIPKDQIAD